MTSADKNVEQLKLASTTGDNAQWFNPPENSLAISLAKVNIKDHIIESPGPTSQVAKDHIKVSI